MATIYLTDDNIDGIIGEVYTIFNQEREAIMAEPVVVPEGIGDDIYSWVLPRESNKKAFEALPEWCIPKIKRCYVKVSAVRDEMTEDSYSPMICLPLKDQWFHASQWSDTVAVPGAEASIWDGKSSLYLFLKDAESGLPQGQAGDFVKQLFAISERHQKITDKTNAAVNTMREFLGQHRTLQTALKECPAILSYVPDWMKSELKRVPPKRTRRPSVSKAEKKEVDMSQLVSQATIAKLNL